MNMAQAQSAGPGFPAATPPVAERSATGSPGWHHDGSRRSLYTLAALVALQVAVYFGTYRSMVDIWSRSETFSHGFLIFPITAWLIWRNREELQQIRFAPDLRALVVLLALVAVWVVARSVDVLVAEQYAAVLMLPVLLWLCLGPRAVWALAFPLAFMLFAVPVGEFLIYPMMGFTASFTVGAVRMTGIPIFADGMYFTLPSGTWNIVEGCSGVRYIIASVTLGALYAYLSYYSYWRRAAFILASCIVPVFANGMRAFIIVMLGHFSNMKIATGVDHLVYGWVWFGIVMFFLFLVGGFFRDEPPAHAAVGATGEAATSSAPVPASRRGYAAALAAVALLALGPLWVSGVASDHGSADFRIPALSPVGGWSPAGAFTEWKPRFINPTAERQDSFSDGAGPVGVYLAYYGHQTQDVELINSQNVMIVQKHPVWREPSHSTRRVQVDGRNIELIESRLESATQHLLVWHWMRVGEWDFSNPLIGKAYEALEVLLGAGRTGFGIAVYAPYTDDPAAARERLQTFLEAMLPSIDVATGND